MTSRVCFDIVGSIPVVYPGSNNISAEVVAGSLSALRVDIEHDEALAPDELVKKAREALRNIVVLLGVGRGLEPVLGTAHIKQLPATDAAKTTGFITLKGDSVAVRSLRSLPAPELLARLAADQWLRKQAERLNAARYAADVVTRIRWAYQVLEQEKIRRPAFAIRDDFRHLRNAVSHPQLKDPNAKAYLISKIGTEMPDLQNQTHLDFLADAAQKLLEEATKIVETALSDHRFWN